MFSHTQNRQARDTGWAISNKSNDRTYSDPRKSPPGPMRTPSYPPPHMSAQQGQVNVKEYALDQRRDLYLLHLESHSHLLPRRSLPTVRRMLPPRHQRRHILAPSSVVYICRLTSRGHRQIAIKVHTILITVRVVDDHQPSTSKRKWKFVPSVVPLPLPKASMHLPPWSVKNMVIVSSQRPSESSFVMILPNWSSNRDIMP
jgi:hypothetical protein